MSTAADLGVCEASDALATGRVSAQDLTQSCVERIESERGQSLKAFIHVDADLALEQAKASDQRRANQQTRSQLDGIPFAVKDNIDVADMPTTNGFATQWMPTADAPIVHQLRDAGMIILGKLNMHEAALGATTDNIHHGRCMHPNFTGYTPGGSSGGSAAAVAAQLCPVTLGTDTMGSVRLPASYCGVVGFKPSPTYWSTEGVVPLVKTLDTVGPLAGSVQDIAAVLTEELITLRLTDIRLGVLENMASVDIEPACTAAFDAVVARLTRDGIKIESVSLDACDLGTARHAGFIISEVEAAREHGQLLTENPQALSRQFTKMLRYGQSVPNDRYLSERRVIEQVGTEFRQLFSDVDVIITLTTPQRAFSFDNPIPANQADLTAIANFAGCPAISLPLPVPVEERPIGLQLISAPATDSRLLAIAHQIEQLLKQ